MRQFPLFVLALLLLAGCAKIAKQAGITEHEMPTVLQAQQALFPQELSLAQTRFAVHNALVNLYKATGGGWVDIAQRIADPPPDEGEHEVSATHGWRTRTIAPWWTFRTKGG